MTLSAIAKVWLAPGEQYARLIQAVLSREIEPCRAAETLGQFQFVVDDIQAWFDKITNSNRRLLSIPELATHLKVKQEVAYHLVRRGLIHSQTMMVRRRLAAAVSLEAVHAFEQSFVRARELAVLLKTSPKALVKILERRGISAITGPEIDGCRQYFYRRSDVGGLTMLGVA